MNNKTAFIDIERFVEWLYANSNLTGETYDKIFKKKSAQNWKTYSKFPNKTTLQDVNALIEEKFEKIDALDLLLCANNAKDHNRGKSRRLPSITSTGKKVLTLLVLGRLIDESVKEGFFTATESKNKDVYVYLSRFNQSSSPTKIFHYYPGRTVSSEQLCSVSRKYKNGINDKAIPYGLRELEKKGLVKCVGDDLFKLDFNGCRNFLKENK